ncbi:MAG: alpha-amylase [Christensenellaceae bacterium]|nr:alpha-amylase [Christensenellaceae bacterium]
MMQYFEWYLPNDGKHWKRLQQDARHLKNLGVGGVWLPPFCKATGTNDVGYGIYDLYDLGEFRQKGSIRTKYGTKKELKKAISKLHFFGIQAYGDIILNHKAGADETETFKVVKVDEENRNIEQSDAFDIEGWTKFTFPGRKNKYSDFKWNFQHFTGVNFDNRTGESAIFRILGEDKGFSPNVSDDMGNYDYLMFADVDYRNKEVINETLKWGTWIIKELNLDGMRLDAIKHIDHKFMESFITHVRLSSKKPLYIVGEYWSPDDSTLDQYLKDTDGLLALFDVSLHYRFVEASHAGRDYDLTTIFDNTLLSRHIFNCSTFVDNHDSQPGQALESWVEDWFKPLAYALILLRQDGYPCIFYGDYYGIGGENPIPGKKEMLDILLEARLRYAYGEQIDYFDHANTIAWIRLGDDKHKNSGLVCIMSNGDDGNKLLNLTEKFANTTWYDITKNIEHDVVLDEDGNGEFTCKGGSLSVYIKK